MAHVDADVRNVPMSTYFVIAKGAELIVAWRREELHEDIVLRDLPSLAKLQSIPSLTARRAVAGDILYMPPNTVHMVVTERDKLHFAFHVYENGSW